MRRQVSAKCQSTLNRLHGVPEARTLRKHLCENPQIPLTCCSSQNTAFCKVWGSHSDGYEDELSVGMWRSVFWYIIIMTPCSLVDSIVLYSLVCSAYLADNFESSPKHDSGLHLVMIYVCVCVCVCVRIYSQKVAGLIKHSALRVRLNVHVFTQNLGQCHLAYLGQLFLREPDSLVFILVPASAETSGTTHLFYL
jgi:hypothetical protein